jgi:hypothetical protein
MSDALLAVLAAVLIATPIVTIYVARYFVKASLPSPRDHFLDAVTWALVGIAISSVMSAILGIHAYGVTFGDFELLPRGTGVFVIAAALFVVTAFEIPIFRWLRREVREAAVRRQQRRRATDVEDRPDA